MTTIKTTHVEVHTGNNAIMSASESQETTSTFIEESNLPASSDLVSNESRVLL